MEKCVAVFEVRHDDGSWANVVKLWNNPVKATEYVLNYIHNVRADLDWSVMKDDQEYFDKISPNGFAQFFGYSDKDSADCDCPCIITLYHVKEEDAK